MQAAHARLRAHVPRRTPSRSSNAHRRRALRVRAASAKDKDDVIVIGAGWGGLAAAKCLCEAGCSVTLIDAIDDPTGATPMLTKTGKPFEPGTRGFWKDYPNIVSLTRELGIAENEAFTEFTPSAFWSPDGLEATAPVFGDSLALPSPLGQVFATFDNFKVGVQQASSLVQGLKERFPDTKPWNVELFGGSPDDNNAYFFYNGAMSVLQPMIDAGEIEIAGKAIHTLSEREATAFRRKGLGIVFQSFNLLSRETALENVSLPLMYAGAGQAAEKAKEALV